MEQPQNTPADKFLSGTTPKISFILGLLVGIAAVSLVGFITLSINKNDGKVAGAKTNENSNANANVAAAPAPSAPIVLKAITDDDHIKGDKNAAVTLVEFSDFQCPYCSKVEPTLQALLKKYEGKIRLVYKHFPLSMHPQAQPAAEASECANEQGKFWEFHEAFYADQTKLADGYYSELAKQFKLDQSKFDQCLSSGKYKQKVIDQTAEGSAAGTQGTPYTVIVDKKGNKTPISGAYPQSTFEAAIDQALAG